MMKKMLSLAAMCAVLAYASPASAELKLGGDASTRVRGQFTETSGDGIATSNGNDLNFAYRLRLKASADLGSGYFVKAMLTSDTGGAASSNSVNMRAGGWNTVANPAEDAEIDISQLYMGRMMENSHWIVGRMPLGSVNNPIFDLTLYPIPFAISNTGVIGAFGSAGAQYGLADIAVATYNMDRVFALNYGCKLGSGEANATLVVFDNGSTDESAAKGDGLFNDGYALHLTYKDKLGNITVEPQAIIALTNLDGAVYQKVTPDTYGVNLSMPAGDAKIGLSGFYTACKDTSILNQEVDYSGYLLRLKGELGNAMAWIDYNKTNDKTGVADMEYTNVFVWAQYNFKLHESAANTFSLTPTIRYWAASAKDKTADTKIDYDRLRTELVATVTF